MAAAHDDLEGARAVLRAISGRLRVATARGDAVAARKFTAQRRLAEAEVARLLRSTDKGRRSA